MPELEKYFYKTGVGKYDIPCCDEKCKIYPTFGVGSLACQKCSEYVDGDNEENWIKCTELKKATGTE